MQILEEARQHNGDRAETIDRAIHYIESNPLPLEDLNLDSVAGRMAAALDVGRWIRNQIDSDFISGREFYTYTATFHNVHGVWKIRGVWETAQGTTPPPAPRKAKN